MSEVTEQEIVYAVKQVEAGVPLKGALPQVRRQRTDHRPLAIEVRRYGGTYPAGDDKADYAWIVELGGFHLSGPGTRDEIVGRYGPGSYRVTAYGFDPPGVHGKC
jgi:hypothetical protein